MNHAWVIDLWEMSFLVYSWKIYCRTIFELHYNHKFNGQSINIPSTCGLILPWTHSISRLTCNWQTALWNIALAIQVILVCNEKYIQHAPKCEFIIFSKNCEWIQSVQNMKRLGIICRWFNKKYTWCNEN